MSDKIREELAEYAHKQWSGWMEYLFSKCEYVLNGRMIIPKWAAERWQKQIKTFYKDLSEKEKTSDRLEADGMLEILSRDEEIKKLIEALREINCMIQDYVVGNVDIYTVMDSIVCHTEEAVKGLT